MLELEYHSTSMDQDLRKLFTAERYDCLEAWLIWLIMYSRTLSLDVLFRINWDYACSVKGPQRAGRVIEIWTKQRGKIQCKCPHLNLVLNSYFSTACALNTKFGQRVDSPYWLISGWTWLGQLTLYHTLHVCHWLPVFNSQHWRERADAHKGRREG